MDCETSTSTVRIAEKREIPLQRTSMNRFSSMVEWIIMKQKVISTDFSPIPIKRQTISCVCFGHPPWGRRHRWTYRRPEMFSILRVPVPRHPVWTREHWQVIVDRISPWRVGRHLHLLNEESWADFAWCTLRLATSGSFWYGGTKIALVGWTVL